MALTLLEAAKLVKNDPLKATVMELYAGSSDILRVLPFENIQGGGLTYNQEYSLPGVAFRGLNEAYTESTGVINPQTEHLVIAGGDLDVDMALIKMRGPAIRAAQEKMKIKALGLKWTKTFLTGSTVSAPKSFDGLQTRLTGTQLVDAGATSGGDVLSLLKLDLMISRVPNAKYLVMSLAMKLKFIAAARTTGVSGYVQHTINDMGDTVDYYNGKMILTVDLDNEGSAILPFTEANPGGGTAASTSIYCMALGDNDVTGIQNGGIDVRDLGELDTKPVLRTRVEWLSGFAVLAGRSAARLQGIKDGAITL